jgi:hypothetical protein
LSQQYPSRTELTSGYFEQTLVPAHQHKHGAIRLPNGQLALYYEARGTLYEPHTGREVPLGTREVEEYRFPAWRFNKVLFIEKKGLWPIFQDARLAERYDMAMVAGEGYSSEACRVLFSHAEKERDYQLFVLHDADPYGYNIARTLCEETRRMPGYRVEVIDLGLKLEDALAMGLPTEDFTRTKELPRELQLSDLERRYFSGDKRTSKAWVARRVELNALTAPALIAYTERKLAEAGVRGKVKPPAPELPDLVEGIYRRVLGEAVDGALEKSLDLDAIKAKLAEAFRQGMELKRAGKWIDQSFEADRAVSWDDAVKRILEATLRDRKNELAAAVRQAAREALASQPLR